jgi:hypothetical protein
MVLTIRVDTGTWTRNGVGRRDEEMPQVRVLRTQYSLKACTGFKGHLYRHPGAYW